MASVKVNGIELSYIERGAGEQTVVFAHSYLLDHRHFEAQIAALEPSYRVIAYDHRDHGRSGRARAAYTLDGELVADAVALIEQTGAAPCHFVGLSTGGFVGMRLALRHPRLLRSVTLMSTSAEAEPWYMWAKYTAMLAVLRLVGTRPLRGAAMRGLFGPTALRDEALAPELAIWRDRVAANDPAALIRFGQAIWSRGSVLGELGRIETPTLIVGGVEDRALPPARSRKMASAIPGARLELIERAGHLTTLEQPEAVNAALVPFIEAAS